MSLTTFQCACQDTSVHTVVPVLVQYIAADAEVECCIEEELLVAKVCRETTDTLWQGITYFCQLCGTDGQTVVAYDLAPLFVTLPLIYIPVTHWLVYVRIKVGGIVE